MVEGQGEEAHAGAEGEGVYPPCVVASLEVLVQSTVATAPAHPLQTCASLPEDDTLLLEAVVVLAAAEGTATVPHAGMHTLGAPCYVAVLLVALAW